MSESLYSQTISENGEKAVQEFALQMSSSSASVPIPGSHRGAHSTYDQFSPSPLINSAIWSNRPSNILLDSTMKLEHESLEPMLSFGMDDDDIFQVDKADLIQGPTLAELNANEDTLLGDLNFDDLLLPEENMQPVRSISSIDLIPVSNSILIPNNTGFASNSFPQLIQSYRNCPQYENISGSEFIKSLCNIEPSEAVSPSSFTSPTASNLAGSSTASSSTSSHPNLRPIGQSSLHELLLKKSDLEKKETIRSHVETIGAMTKSKISRLSMSAPTQSLGMDQLWIHREPRQHLLSTGSLEIREAESTSSISTGGALSPNPLGHLDPLSHDEGYEDSDDDSDHYDDYSSENDSAGSDIEENHFNGKLANELLTRDSKQKKEKYFWQYNVQAKGPKGQRLVARARLENPHVLNEATDPVFSPHCALRGIKHSGKARKGDGNDLTPNPRKLHSIGKELDKLSQIINDMTPVSELPFLVRPKTRKEKNKLASRACRLKKKAQHEANKIKLHGLEQEHRRLINGIQQAKQILAAKLSETNLENQEELSKKMDKICKNASKVKIANHSTEFVNKVLDKVKGGISDGGIDDF